jgi:outer membrane protein assembly factor BamE (lipoprotein component of BamABCDE complex)
MKKRNRLLTCSVCLIGVLGLALVATSVALGLVDSCPVNPELMQRLAAGMSKTDVQRLLGDPSTIADEGREWRYTKAFSWGVLYIQFQDGKLVDYHYDP